MKIKFLVFGIPLRLNSFRFAFFLFSVLFILSILQAALSPGSFVTKGPASSRKIALTFDDGPGPQTALFIEMLDRHQVKATFFMLAEQVKYRPAVAKSVADRGHEVANHTTSHINYLQRYRSIEKDLPQSADRPNKAADLARKELIKDMSESRKTIENASGVKLNILRMPHGIDRPWIKDAAKETGFILVNWTYGADWLKDSEAELEKAYIKAIEPGAILLFHDGGSRREKSLKLAEAVIRSAKEKGFDIVTVGELLGLK